MAVAGDDVLATSNDLAQGSAQIQLSAINSVGQGEISDDIASEDMVDHDADPHNEDVDNYPSAPSFLDPGDLLEVAV